MCKYGAVSPSPPQAQIAPARVQTQGAEGTETRAVRLVPAPQPRARKTALPPPAFDQRTGFSAGCSRCRGFPAGGGEAQSA